MIEKSDTQPEFEPNAEEVDAVIAIEAALAQTLYAYSQVVAAALARYEQQSGRRPEGGVCAALNAIEAHIKSRVVGIVTRVMDAEHDTAHALIDATVKPIDPKTAS